MSNRAFRPSQSATSSGPWRLLAWRHTVPVLLWVGILPVRPLRISPGRPSHREGSSYFTGPSSRCQTELSGPPRPRQTPGLGRSWHGDTPYPCCFGFGILPARPPRIAPGRPSHREGLDYFTGPLPRCQTELSGPSPPATASGSRRLLAWRHTVPVLLWVWDPSGTSTPDRSGPSVSPAGREEHYGVRDPLVKSAGRPGMSRR